MQTFKKALVATVGISAALLTDACNPTGSLGGGSSSGSGGGTPTPTTTAPPTTIGGGGNTAGALALTQVSPPEWRDQNGAINIGSFQTVPGDVLTYQASYRLTLQGGDLKARLTADDVTLTGSGPLKSHLHPQVTATVGGKPLPTGPTGVIVTPDQNNEIVNVVATFTFDTQTDSTVAQSDSVRLEDFHIRLEQIPN